METEQTTENASLSENNGGEGETLDTIAVPKADYEKLNQTLGSLKRELKDLKKSKETPKEESETPKNQPNDALLQKLEKISLRQAGITHPDDMEFARATAKKWGMDIDDVLSDEDFKVKLERTQSARANIDATSNVRGSSGTKSGAKDSAEYWIAKGTPPTPADVPNAKTRRKIVRELVKSGSSNGKKFYND